MTVDNTFIVLHTLVQSVRQCGDLVATLHVLKEEPDFSCSFWCDTLNDIDRSLEPPQPRFLIDIIVKLPFWRARSRNVFPPNFNKPIIKMIISNICCRFFQRLPFWMRTGEDFFFMLVWDASVLSPTMGSRETIPSQNLTVHPLKKNRALRPFPKEARIISKPPWISVFFASWNFGSEQKVKKILFGSIIEPHQISLVEGAKWCLCKSTQDGSLCALSVSSGTFSRTVKISRWRDGEARIGNQRYQMKRNQFESHIFLRCPQVWVV